MLYILAVFIILVIIFEYPGLFKDKSYKEIVIVSLLLLLSTAYGIAYHLRSDILPNPNRILYFFDPLAETFQMLMDIGDEVQQ